MRVTINGCVCLTENSLKSQKTGKDLKKTEESQGRRIKNLS
jgi:hypothetical protein